MGKLSPFLPASYLLKVAVRCPACLAFLGEPADVAPAAAAGMNPTYLRVIDTVARPNLNPGGAQLRMRTTGSGFI